VFADGIVWTWAWWWKLLGLFGREPGQDECFQTLLFVRAEGRAAGFSGEVFIFEAGVFDEGEPFFFDHVDETDWFGLLATFAASWRGEDDLAPAPPGWITLSSRGRDDSEFRTQRAASGAVAALMTADSAGVFAGMGGAGAVVRVNGRHVSLDCTSCKIDQRS